MTDRRVEIAEVLRRRILRGLQAGTLQPGDRLPSARDLKTDFDVDHRLVLDAYRQLVAEGLVEMRQRGGIYLEKTVERRAAALAPSERWLVDVIADGVARELPVSGVVDSVRRATETLRLRAIAVQNTPDQIDGMCRELRDDYGLESTGIDAAALARDFELGDLPPQVARADILVTTEAYAALVRGVAAHLGKSAVVASVRPDLIGGEWRLLLRKPVYVVVRDARFAELLRQFFARTPGRDNLRIRVVGSDDVGGIPAGASTYVTRSARTALGTFPLPGSILPSTRVFSAASSRELIGIIVRANLRALGAR